MFIQQTYLTDLTICDDLIKHFNDNKNKTVKGTTYQNEVRVDVKDSTDLQISDYYEPVVNRYVGLLQESLNEYKKEYTFADYYAPYSIIEAMNIQHYKPGQGFHAWHTERYCGLEINSKRHLTWMTYLNDVEDEGETEFYYQKLKVKPKKGLTLIWPADWTHTHRGIPSKTQEKYIATGWYSFTD